MNAPPLGWTARRGAAPALRDVARERFRRDVLAGLSRPRKTLLCKYLYDERGSALFERICELDEYYPTRTELAILEAHAGEMAERLGAQCLLVEYGSGSSRKTRLLLDRLRDPVAYVPIDISSDALGASARALAAAYPALEELPVCADYTEALELPRPARSAARRGVFFPGSTIGNFTPPEAQRFLGRMARVAGPRGGLLIGVDLRKDRGRLEPAYDDALGVTAAFNKNLLERINRELGADFDVDRFRHRAYWNAPAGRVEMHLVSEIEQSVGLVGSRFHFEAGEAIHTENSYKYELDQFAALASRVGLSVRRVWTDPDALFSVQFLTVG